MEESECTSFGPDENGLFNLSYIGWTEVPSSTFDSFQYRLVDLNLSYNKLLSLTETIGLCCKLRRLNISHNRLTVLPSDLCRCYQLEILDCSSNMIEEIPDTFEGIRCLEELDVRNNRLLDLPDHLAALPCMKKISCDGNEKIPLPKDIMIDGELVLWYLQIRQANNYRLTEKYHARGLVERNAQNQEFDRFAYAESTKSISIDIQSLESERPMRYLELKDALRSSTTDYIENMRRFLRSISGRNIDPT